ncbi:hypothetical protein TNCV_4097941 [Trichonephila clavipes]|nr:hypothetical protein TNCV_4097941 [Trichonephila clavipes]
MSTMDTDPPTTNDSPCFQRQLVTRKISNEIMLIRTFNELIAKFNETNPEMTQLSSTSIAEHQSKWDALIHRNTVTKLQQHRGTEGKNETFGYPKKSKSNRNEIIYSKYPLTRIPHYTNPFAHRQEYGRWNWKNDQSQYPDIITGSRYNRSRYSPQLPSPSYHYPSFSLQRLTMYPRNQRLPQRPAVLQPDAPTFYPRQRTQENNTVFQPHRT